MPTANLDAAITRLQNFAANYQQLGESIVTAHSDDIAELQRGQLSQGLTSEGQPITPEYSPYTVALKEKYGVGLGAVTDHVTFYQTGQLYSLLQVMVNNGKYSITANTEKFGLLEDKYGENAFGLDSESAAIFATTIAQPEVIKAFNEQVVK